MSLSKNIFKGGILEVEDVKDFIKQLKEGLLEFDNSLSMEQLKEIDKLAGDELVEEKGISFIGYAEGERENE